MSPGKKKAEVPRGEQFHLQEKTLEYSPRL